MKTGKASLLAENLLLKLYSFGSSFTPVPRPGSSAPSPSHQSTDILTEYSLFGQPPALSNHLHDQGSPSSSSPPDPNETTESTKRPSPAALALHENGVRAHDMTPPSRSQKPPSPVPIPEALWTKLRSQMSALDYKRPDWAGRCAEESARRKGTSRVEDGYACDYCLSKK